jgi:hypothetical protein
LAERVVHAAKGPAAAGRDARLPAGEGELDDGVGSLDCGEIGRSSSPTRGKSDENGTRTKTF